MTNQRVHRHRTATPPSQAVGRVVDILPDDYFIVRHDRLGWQCRLAASCLLRPQTGDDVLIAGDHSRLWLLAVLERADSSSPCCLAVKGDLHIAAGGALALKGETRLALAAPQLGIEAERGECRIERMRYHGRSLSACVDIVCMVGKRFESVCQTLVHISHRWLRKVTQTEHARVGQLDYQAEDYARLHGQNVMITAEAITRIDAEQIHMG